MGIVFNIQRFCLYDGPGVRTVVFLKGCPLHCVWCHNPEGLTATPQLLYNPARCIGCGDCKAVCPAGCHKLEDGLHRFERTACIGCGKCAAQCCTGALSVAGEEMTPQAVMEQVLRDRQVYLESGGGLTLSGGEPFAQPDFALRLLQLAKEAGIHTCVETSGFCSQGVIEKAAKYTDLFLYDYKATGTQMHQMLCGVSGEKILSNLNTLDTLGTQVILRCPIVPGQNDSADHLHGIAAVAAAHSCIKEVHLEPYHRLGIDKAAQLGMQDVFDATPPDKALMEQYRRQVHAACGKPVWISS